jgi:hypothetical protein
MYNAKPINNMPIQTRSIRYMSSSGSDASAQFLKSDLFAILFFATSSTDTVTLFRSVKLNSVTVSAYAEPDSTTSTQYFCFGWKGEKTPGTCKTFHVGPSIPTRKVFRPPKDSLISMWCNAYDNIDTSLFDISWGSSISIVLDLNFNYILGDGSNDNTSFSGSGMTTGYIYAGNLPISSNEFTPIGLTSGVL